MPDSKKTVTKFRGVSLLYEVRVGAAPARKVVLSPDGNILALVLSNGSVQLRDATTGRWLRTIASASSSKRDATWSPDGQSLATAADDVIQIWRASSGQLLRSFAVRLRGHMQVAWSPAGTLIASAHPDGTIRIWDATHGTLVDLLKEHTGAVTGLAWSPDGSLLASSATDKTARLWEPATGRLHETMRLQSTNASLAWSPDGSVLALAAGGATIHLWNRQTGRAEDIIEGHTNQVTGLSFSSDGGLLASVTKDTSVRLWACDSWRLATTFKLRRGAPSDDGGLAFGPKSPVLVVLEGAGRHVSVWSLDTHAILQTPPADESVKYVTAKVALVGDTGVGKTCLGWRLAYDEFKVHPSTHGQQLYLSDGLKGERADGGECVVALCDSAGQPDYRFVNTLFLDDAALALLVFDPMERREPLAAVEYWLNQLSADGAHGCRRILVGTKIDDRPLAVTAAELDGFCQRYGIEGGYVLVSALTGAGLDELRARIKSVIRWDELPAVLTTSTFKTVKDVVLRLKSRRPKSGIIVSQTSLRRQLKASAPRLTLSDAELDAALAQLAVQSHVTVLGRGEGKASILLAPERLIQLAASLIQQARNHPSGLGTLDETQLLRAGGDLPELADLKQAEREALLDAVTMLFLQRGVCFRQVLGQQTLLIFPSLVRQEKPPERELQTEEDFSYVLRESTENVYAMLAALLGYTNIFMRSDQWRNHAEYEVSPSEVCGFKQVPGRGSDVELILYYGVDVEEATRNIFRGLFEKFLLRAGQKVIRYAPTVCPNSDCSYRQERALILRRRLEGKEYVCCSDCGKELLLSEGEVLTPAVPRPVPLRHADSRRLEAELAHAGQRLKFEAAMRTVESLARRTGGRRPTCFVSYAWGDERHAQWVRDRLVPDMMKASIEVVLDQNDNARIGANIARFISRIRACDYIVCVGTPLYLRKCQNEDKQSGSVVAAELDLINQRLLRTEAEKSTVLPLLLEGEDATALPDLMRGRVYGDFRQSEFYFATLLDLILTLWQIPFSHEAVKRLREDLREPVD